MYTEPVTGTVYFLRLFEIGTKKKPYCPNV